MGLGYEQALTELQGLLGSRVHVGVGTFRKGDELPVVAGVIGELRRAATGVMWSAPPGAEHVAFQVGKQLSDQGGYFLLVRELFKTAQWTSTPGERELGIVQGDTLITVGPAPAS